MSQETTLLFQTDLPIPFTVADGTAITKGSVLKLTSPMTAIITSGAGDAIAGIAATDKIANNGTTTLGVYREGIFVGYASGSITVGDALVTDAAANFLKTSVLNTSGSQVVGRALETVTTGQTFKFELNVGADSGAYH